MAERNFDVVVSKPQSLTGGVTFAPLGTEIPSNFSKKLGQEFKPMGYVSADGVSLSEDASDEEIQVWGGVKVRTVRSSYSAKIKLTVYSTADSETLKAIFGADNVSVTDDGVVTILHGSDMAPVQAYTIETKDPNNGYQRRFAIERGQVTVSGDRSLTHSAADSFEISIECLADPETGICYREYTLVPKTPKVQGVRGVVNGGA